MLCMAQLAGMIAWLNLSALIISAAARDGFLFRPLGDMHPITGSPYKAVLLLAVLSAAIPGCTSAFRQISLIFPECSAERWSAINRI